MAKSKAAEKLVTVKAAVPVVIWRANRPLTDEQHEELARKLRAERQHVGVELLLVPYSTDVEIAIDDRTAPLPATEEETTELTTTTKETTAPVPDPSGEPSKE